MSNYTAETPARCPKCGCALTERTGRSMREVVYMYDCDHCGWDDEYARADRLTVATAPWTRDLWAEVERQAARIIELEAQVESGQALLRAVTSVSAECWKPDAEDPVVRVRSRVVGTVLRNMVQSCIEAGGANNLTISMGPGQDDSDLAGYRWEVHVVKPGGKSPTEQRREVEAERDAAAAKERAAVVAWLRLGCAWGVLDDYTPDQAADAIEAGDHLEATRA